ncbi:MAG: CoA transferase [Proteobacteria bacterium]|nr:MAG: CoA transferase [Pseudomonadota bacterium]
MTAAPKPLEGITVVAVEQAVAAPFATARLRDAGARVIKIEREGGDFARGYDKAACGDSSYFVWLNQGKESVVLDFKQEDGASLLRALVERADVFVQNLSPGALDRAGFGSAALRERYPRLVTCDISGYGDAEAMSRMRAYDLLVQAESGLAAVSGGREEIGRIGVSICDIGAGMTAHAAILEALFRRQRGGEGAALAVSLFGVAAEWMTVPLIHNDYGAGPPAREGLRHPSIAPYGAYATGDGVETLISVQNEREWRRLCESVLGRPGMTDDRRFADNDSRVANRDALDAAIEDALAGIDATRFRELLLAHEIAFGAVNAVPELSRHAALRRRVARNVTGDPVAIPAHPVDWRGENWRDTPGAPAPGGDGDRIVEELAGGDKSW